MVVKAVKRGRLEERWGPSRTREWSVGFGADSGPPEATAVRALSALHDRLPGMR
jgi:hypothetical protein